jgi:DNA-binding transcriptional regulator LsrR (DeoR family)
LKAAHVLTQFRGSDDALLERLGQLAARTLEAALEAGMTLGISLGRAVAATSRAFKVSRDIHCKVLRLQGASKDEIMEGTDLAQVFAAQLGGEYQNIPSPWIMKSREACELILQEPSVRDVIREAERTDSVLVGMGSTDPATSTILGNKLITADELRSISDLGAAGEICGKFYNQAGVPLDVDFNHRSVSIDIGKLRRVATVIGVAAGPSKVNAIQAAIQGKLINVLVTDSEAATLLLAQEEP